MNESIDVNGYNIYPFQNKKGFLAHLKSGHWNNILIAINAEKIMLPDDKLKELVNENIGYPDGVGAVLALKKRGEQAGKIAGAEFWLDIVREFYTSKSFYFVGGKKEVINETVEKLEKQFKGINILGYRDGYFNDSQYDEILADIQLKKPDIVFVAMGSPKQEYIMEEMKEKHPALYMGLGGSFDVYTGSVKRAPKAWINLNLEWAYRLVKQPKRIFRQVALFKFVNLLLTNRI